MYCSTILFLILAGCAVKSDESSNYFVVQMPDEIYPRAVTSKKMQVYWNVPTIQCASKRIPFEKLQERYGIIQNQRDTFRGDRISIMYDPGYFPAIFKNASTGELVLRNGGVPQEGDLDIHMKQFRKDVEHQIEDPNFDGIGIIDFESWRPIFRQNFGNLEPYQKLSIELERQRHWWWPSEWIKAEATRRFEESARTFMQNTLAAAKQMRPNASWGYYGFPHCFNNPPGVAHCAKQVPEENDRLYWLWSESTALYPSIYSVASLSTAQLAAFIKARVTEAARVARGTTPILPYWWFRYRDGGYFTQTDLNMTLQTLYRSSASGFLIWGSSADVNTPDKCHSLLKFIENVLGPSIAKYTRSDSKTEVLNEMEIQNDENNQTTFVVTNMAFGVDFTTDGTKSTVEIKANADKDNGESKMMTQDHYNVTSGGQIGILTSTTEMGFVSDGQVYSSRTASPIIRILSASYQKDASTSMPTEETVFSNSFSTAKEQQSTTLSIDTMQSTLSIEDYEKYNTTEIENDDVFFNEEDFFDNPDIFSNYEDLVTSTVASTTNRLEITTDTEIPSTEDDRESTKKSLRPTTQSPITQDQIYKTNSGDEYLRLNREHNPMDIFETSSLQYFTKASESTVSTTEILYTMGESTTEIYLDEFKQYENDITSTGKPIEMTTSEIVSVLLNQDLLSNTEISEKSNIKEEWNEYLLRGDEETNETFEDNETILKGDPTSMGLTSGNDQVLI